MWFWLLYPHFSLSVTIFLRVAYPSCSHFAKKKVPTKTNKCDRFRVWVFGPVKWSHRGNGQRVTTLLRSSLATLPWCLCVCSCVGIKEIRWTRTRLCKSTLGTDTARYAPCQWRKRRSLEKSHPKREINQQTIWQAGSRWRWAGKKCLHHCEPPPSLTSSRSLFHFRVVFPASSCSW